MRPPAEVEVDETLVQLLLAEQHPDLAGQVLLHVDGGWDNVLWRLGDELLVRLPRHSVAAGLTANEQRWLPVLAPRLPLPVPVPIRIGEPSDAFRWRWSVVPWLAGAPADRAAISEPGRAADALGRFLRALHQAAPAQAPTNPYRSVPLAQRSADFERRLAAVSDEVEAERARRVWEQALDARPWAGPPSWLHGDLHPANMLIAAGSLAAVLDFGDVCAGDPATDLASVFMLLPASAAGDFAAAYGGVDPDLGRRSRGWAMLFGLMLLGIGRAGRPTYRAVGRCSIATAMEPWLPHRM